MADDCRTLLVSDDELSRALTMIQDYRSGRRDFPEEDLWRAKKGALSTAPSPPSSFLSLSRPTALRVALAHPPLCAAGRFLQSRTPSCTATRARRSLRRSACPRSCP